MDIQKIVPGVNAYISHRGGPNVGLIQTSDGIVMVDSASAIQYIRDILEAHGATPSDVCQIFITHSHTDHSNGINLFDCPIIVHKITHKRIMKRGTLPPSTQAAMVIFEDRQDFEIGDVQIGFFHAGGHTPGSSVVWLPETKVLFSGDLLYGGRYPILAVAQVLDLMKAMRWLLTFEAYIIMPGHGYLCGNDEINKQLVYIEATWERTADHLSQGHSIEETLADPDYPRYSELGANLHDGNIKKIYKQCKKELNKM
jgi:cyclase